MPKKGGKRGKRGQSNYTRKAQDINKDATDGQVYGQVIAAVGNKRFTVRCQTLSDPNQYIIVNCGMKGSLRKTITSRSYVLVQCWELGSEVKATILDLYNLEEKARLNNKGFWDYVDDPSVFTGETTTTGDLNLVEFELEEDTVQAPAQVEQTANDQLAADNLVDKGAEDIDLDCI